jgi:hypothetical protein
MELKVVRFEFTDKSTISRLFVDGQFECVTLEDVCREKTPGTWIPKLKVFGETAIPYGRYTVVMSYSNRFKMVTPELLNVPDYTAVRIHAGNFPADTEGCLLVGQIWDTNQVLASRAALGSLLRKMESAYKTEKIFIEVTKA